jgi:hypothetical protein
MSEISVLNPAELELVALMVRTLNLEIAATTAA